MHDEYMMPAAERAAYANGYEAGLKDARKAKVKKLKAQIASLTYINAALLELLDQPVVSKKKSSAPNWTK